MDSAKRKALQAAGWKVGDAADFLDMNEEERQLLEGRRSRSYTCTMDTTIAHTRPLEQFLRVLRAHLAELQRRYRIRSLALFGSYVRGEDDQASDLDILVEFDAAPTFFRFIELEDELSGLLQVKVDLVMKSALRPHLAQRILAEAVSL